VLFKPLKPKAERRERGVVIDTTFTGEEGGGKFTAMKVPMQCPLVLLIKID
jgi:hypothetical protein